MVLMQDTESSIKERPIGRSAFWAISAGLLFAGLWSVPKGYGLAGLVLLPMVWSMFPRRLLAGLFVLTYYLAASWELLPGLLKFSHHHYGLFLCVGLWLADALLLSLLWLVLYPPKDASWQRMVGSLTAILCLSSVPPLGALNWLHPFTAAGYLFPGMGWLGFLSCYVLMLAALLAFRMRGEARRRASLFMGFALLLALIVNLSYRTPKPPSGWLAINTDFGELCQNALYGDLERQQRLIAYARQAITQQQVKVVVFPENAPGIWWPATLALWQPIIKVAKQHGAIIVMGVEEHDKRFKNKEGVLVLGGKTARYYEARQTVPLLFWQPSRPLKNSGIRWLQSGVVTIGNRSVWLSVCYEDVLVWTNLWPMLIPHRPQMLISISNEWWNLRSAIFKQKYAIMAWSRLFDLPLIRAVNL